MNGVEFWWIGQSGFRLRDPAGGPALFVDPFLSPHARRTWEAPIGPPALAEAAAILCTHEHTDHFDRPAIQAANQIPGARFTLVLPEPVVEQARDLGIPRERIVAAQPGQRVDAGGFTVYPVPACHGLKMADAYSFGEAISGGRVRFLGYVVEVGGIRVYHAGDTIPYPGMVETLKALAPQVALLPINGRDFFRETEQDLVGNMDVREAAHLADAIGAQWLVPMHWGLFPYNTGSPAELAAYIAAQYPGLTLLLPGRGARFVYSRVP